MPRRKRRFALAAGALLVLLLVLLASLRVALQPDRVARLVLRQAGAVLGLEVTAAGGAQYALRGTPRLVLRGVQAREPGARSAVLRAQRLLVSVPWATLRSRGALLDVQRIELDAPVLDLAALQRWRAKRPPSETRLPTLVDGLAIKNGRIEGQGWRIESLQLELPRFAPARPVSATARGRYAGGGNTLGFDLSLAMSTPVSGAGAAAVGTLRFARADWALPARIRAYGPVRFGDAGALEVLPLRLAMAATYTSGDTREPFALGANGPLRLANGIWTLAPAGIAVRGTSLLPEFDARGALAWGQQLVLRLQGRLPAWKQQWPALPPPLGQSTSALPFALDYAGPVDFSAVAALRLQRNQARFDGRLRVPDVIAWGRAPPAGSPLPPLSGTVSAATLEISGATLHGVEVEFDDPQIDAAADRQ